MLVIAMWCHRCHSASGHQPRAAPSIHVQSCWQEPAAPEPQDAPGAPACTGSMVTVTAATAHVTHRSSQAACAGLALLAQCTQPSSTPVWPKNRKKKSSWCKLSYRRPSVSSCSVTHSFIFLRLSSSSLKLVPLFITPMLGARGRLCCYLEKGLASQFISCLVQWGKLRTEIGLTLVYKPKCQRADNVYCKCQRWGISLFPLKKNPKYLVTVFMLSLTQAQLTLRWMIVPRYTNTQWEE